MEPNKNPRSHQLLGRWISLSIVAVALALGLVVLYHANHYPRTEDAEVFANFIGIAPQVNGPLIRLNVKDNQFVKKGELLYEIDESPYQYAVEDAVSEQAALEGQISDERRKIAALVSAVSVAQANIQSMEANVINAERGVGRARAEWNYANNNLHRLEPLLTKQFVTVDQVDRARSSETADAEALKQAESQCSWRRQN
jgi:membrane fusion protein, multidrug efflux system